MLFVISLEAYVDFVNNVVIEGFVSAIAVSLQYLCEILDPLIIARHEMLPLFDAWMQDGKRQKLCQCSRMCTCCTCLVADEMKLNSWNEYEIRVNESILIDHDIDCQGKLMSDGKTSRINMNQLGRFRWRSLGHLYSDSHVPRWLHDGRTMATMAMTSRGCEDWAPGHWDRLRSALWGGPNEWPQQACTIAKTQVIQQDMFWTDLIKWQWECMEIWIGTCSQLFFSGELEVKRQWWRYQCNAWLCRMKTMPVGPHWEVPSTVGWKTSSRWQRSWYRDCKIASKKHDTTWWYKNRHVIDIGWGKL